MKKICLILFLPLLLIGCKNNTSANPEDVADSNSLTVEVEDSTLVNDSIVIDTIPLDEEKAPEKVHVTVLREHKVIVEEIEPEINIEVDTIGVMPQFPGGDQELMKFISNNLKYPVIAQENGIQGRVTLRFVVKKDGSIADIQIIRGLDPSCDKEAMRVVKAMPRWIPGKQNGQTADISYVLPVNFRLLH
ncbi:energy transducer TonB [Dysgonomonas macrotermitis]|uniref:TonB family C-terminal domain-containing protein n=1 Tax=Dysgonomonas macrotermitis TaxID=1346286 RepID=A0A1M5GH48_9BACT|nr:energy transducer TonB [Dysgonomonas macrotermitis]SHG03047.1 TonB family C-terminal domain-containing protein [Dysgonomonas macrotermitis]